MVAIEGEPEDAEEYPNLVEFLEQCIDACRADLDGDGDDEDEDEDGIIDDEIRTVSPGVDRAMIDVPWRLPPFHPGGAL